MLAFVLSSLSVCVSVFVIDALCCVVLFAQTDALVELLRTEANRVLQMSDKTVGGELRFLSQSANMNEDAKRAILQLLLDKTPATTRTVRCSVDDAFFFSR